MKALQHFLGHSSLMTTDNYLRGFGYEDAARELRFALVIEAAWDDEVVIRRPEPEGYVDPRVRRFQLLDLD